MKICDDYAKWRCKHYRSALAGSGRIYNQADELLKIYEQRIYDMESALEDALGRPFPTPYKLLIDEVKRLVKLDSSSQP